MSVNFTQPIPLPRRLPPKPWKRLNSVCLSCMKSRLIAPCVFFAKVAASGGGLGTEMNEIHHLFDPGGRDGWLDKGGLKQYQL